MARAEVGEVEYVRLEEHLFTWTPQYNGTVARVLEKFKVNLKYNSNNGEDHYRYVILLYDGSSYTLDHWYLLPSSIEEWIEQKLGIDDR